MLHTSSITNLRNNMANVIDSLRECGVVLVVRHSDKVAYLVTPELFEGLMERLQALEDTRAVNTAVDEYRQGDGAVDADKVFSDLGI